MGTEAYSNAGDPERRMRRRKFLASIGGTALAFSAVGLLAGCNNGGGGGNASDGGGQDTSNNSDNGAGAGTGTGTGTGTSNNPNANGGGNSGGGGVPVDGGESNVSDDPGTSTDPEDFSPFPISNGNVSTGDTSGGGGGDDGGGGGDDSGGGGFTS